MTITPLIRQWMCHTFLRAIFYKQYAIFKDQIEYNNNSTSVFQWTLHFSSRHIVNLLSDKKNISSIVIVQNEAKV